MSHRRRDNESRGARGARGRGGRGRGNYYTTVPRVIHDSPEVERENVRGSYTTVPRVFRDPREVERENVRILSDNFNSSELTYEGSDKIVFIPHEDELQSIWKRSLKKEFTNQHHIRRFLNSCLVITSKDGHEVEELISRLAEPDGRQRLREIVMFHVSVDAGLQPHVASFQRVTLPFLALLIRSGITDSILETQINAIYNLVYSNLENFMHDKVMTMLETLVQRNSLADQRVSQNDLLKDDSSSFIPTSLGQFFLVIVRLCNFFLNRIKEASSNETMNKIAQRLENVKEIWQNSFLIQRGDPNDPLYSDVERRNYFFFVLNKEFNKMKRVIKNSTRVLLNSDNNITTPSSISYKERAQIVDLKRSYDPPGELSKHGPRNNNDFSDISKISIIPTKEEILSDRPPFLPTNIPGAPHFLPEGTARLLDSQFRLLREDMLSPIRGGITSFLRFLTNPTNSKHNEVKLKKFKEVGGRFKYESDQDSGDLCIYANARFVGITVDRRRGFSCRIAFTGPKNAGKSKKDRIFYWQKSKKLMNGSLVCLLWPTVDTTSVNRDVPNTNQYSPFFGVIVQRTEELLAKFEDRVEIDINFTDAAIYPLALRDISNQKNRNMNQNISSRFMVESTGVYLESYYHILRTLQSSNNSILPFEKYLTMPDENYSSTVDVPDYARAPGFRFDLSVLLRDKQRQLLLNVANKNEHKNVIKELSNGSSLDESQAEALVTSLCKEIALIEGPPGTGKTVVGVEIMKVLLAKENRNINLGPILTICFTNHALDQFLEHLIDKAGIDNIVRLGGRSKSEKISPFNLEEISKNREKPVGVEGYLLAQAYKSLEDIQKKADNFQKTLSRRWLNWKDVSDYLYVDFNDHYNKFLRYKDDPETPSILLDDLYADESSWKAVGSDSGNKTLFEKWLHGMDIKNAKSMIQAMKNPKQERKENKKRNTNINTYDILGNYDDEFGEYEYSFEDEEYYDTNESFLSNWEEPKTNRPLEILKEDTCIWRMSTTERITLHDFWRQEINDECVEELAKLQKAHDEKRGEVDGIHDERRKKILKECDVIGMTTNGAAKFQTLIRSVGPRIIICEEAGEVLESHILSVLTPSKQNSQHPQHLILIGDHNQLRPRIATYKLSCDSRYGKKYALDESLFERLVNGDKATRLDKSQLLTQRRMRAREISDLVRDTLYPSLIDGEKTKGYPDIRGAQQNVYFINHRHLEDKGKNEFAIQSHSNQYEVDMVIEMVNYFVRNGYTKQDDIAVLTPYLGQMMKLRDALKKTFTVVIDERDSQDLAEMEDDNDGEEKSDNNGAGNIGIAVATKKSLNQQVTLRTVDNFQGEEANIVIISLVRNALDEANKSSIGFLKSTNRSNVLLSRARHGMYLLGNAELMTKESPDMWGKVIKMLKSRNPPQVGDSFPIVCPQHLDNRNNVKEPKEFNDFAPDGGCLESCGRKLECGHTCPYKCHSDNPDHVDIRCRKPCTKLHPECGHPCEKNCGEKCGNCTLIIGDKVLPCGHNYPNMKCHEERNIESIRCKEKVLKKLPKCGHELEVKCHESVDDIICKQPCGQLNKCSHPCLAPCFECQKRSIKANNGEPPLDENGHIKRDTHRSCNKVCERNLFCGHKCKDTCHEGKNCSPCTAVCTVSCSHSSCKSECFKPCTSCAEPCDWHCPHGKGRCLLSCGAPCSRLPCNLRCEKNLECGHRCPGVCGENCPTRKFCEICASDDVKEQMIDYIEFKTFAEIDWGIERMIILECGHVFTMETMDGHMEMENYYEGGNENWTSVKMLSSQTGENKIMTCPNCRAPIKNIKRYGRSIKKRILDTQNKKFLTQYDLVLRNQRNRLEVVREKIENGRQILLTSFRNNRIGSANRVDDKKKVHPNKTVLEVAIIEQFFQIEKYNSIPEPHANLWKKHVKELLKLYEQLMLIISHTKNPPYKKAFEAAVTRLYNEKSKIQYDSLVSNFENFRFTENIRSSENQKAHFEQSLREVGLIAPQFDRRIYLDAFLEIVNIQKIMFDEATRIVLELPKIEHPSLNNGISVLTTRMNWIEFCNNIIDSIKNHLEIICQTCEESKYGRHLALASLELVEFEYQVGRFNLNSPQTPDGILADPHKENIKKKCDKIRRNCDKIYSDVLPRVNLEHFQGKCVERIDKLLNDVDKLQETAERSGQLSQEEKLGIYRAMSSEFSGAGHWYECPNGHPYTIGECGGPMQASRCPDCGAAVGGGDHILVTENRRNVEFETMGGGAIRF